MRFISRYIVLLIIPIHWSCQNSDPISLQSPVVVSEVSKMQGVVGEEITIKGQHFSEVPTENRVSFNDIIAQVSQASSTALKVIIPNQASTGPLEVSRKGGQAINVGIFEILSAGGPKITRILNVSGQPSTSFEVGEVMVIEGENFDNNAEKNIITFNGTIVKSSDMINVNSREIRLVVPGEAASGPFIISVFGIPTPEIPLTIQALDPTEEGRIYWSNLGRTGNSFDFRSSLMQGKNSVKDIPSGKEIIGLNVAPFFYEGFQGAIDPTLNRLYYDEAFNRTVFSGKEGLSYIDINTQQQESIFVPGGLFSVRPFAYNTQLKKLYVGSFDRAEGGTLSIHKLSFDESGQLSSPPEKLNVGEFFLFIGMSKNRLYFSVDDYSNGLTSNLFSTDLEGKNRIDHSLTIKEQPFAGVGTERFLVMSPQEEDIYFCEKITNGNFVSTSIWHWSKPTDPNNTPVLRYGPEKKIDWLASLGGVCAGKEHIYFFRNTDTGVAISRVRKDGSSVKPVDVYSNLGFQEGDFTSLPGNPTFSNTVADTYELYIDPIK